MDRAAASALRHRINRLRQERERLEEQCLEIRGFLRGCLVVSRHLRGGQSRPREAFYLCRRDEGRQRLHYIRQADLDEARREVAEYRRYRKALQRLRSLSREILKAFGELQEALDVRERGK